MKIYKVIIFFIIIISNVKSADFNFFNSFKPFQGARLSAFAGSLIADDLEPGIMYYNPAGLTYLKNYNISINNYQEKSINGFAHGIIFPINISKSEGMAFSINALHVGYLNKQTNNPLKFGQIAYNIAYSNEIIPTLSIGSVLGIQYSKSDYNDRWTFRSVLGIYYLPRQEISYSLIVGEFGNGIRYVLSDNATILRIKNLANGVKVGITMRYPLNLTENLFSLSIASEKIFGTKGVRYQSGMEINFVKYIICRLGYYVSDSTQFATYGVGVKFFKLWVDVAISPQKKTNKDFFVTFSYKMD